MAATRLNTYNGLKISDIKVESNATQAIPAATIDPAAVDLNDETVCSLNSDLGTHIAKIKANGERTNAPTKWIIAFSKKPAV